MNNWLSNNFIEIFGAVTGIIYVILEIRQKVWLWPVGIATSAAYVWIFFTARLYADMSLQSYYVVISVLGWYWWVRGRGAKGAERRSQGTKQRAQGAEQGAAGGEQEDAMGREGDKEKQRKPEEKNQGLSVTRINTKLTIILFVIFVAIWTIMYFILRKMTNSPVPGWDAFITSLSIIGTWMLARKIYEHWYIWVVVNFVSIILYFTRGLYPTVLLYIVYLTMSFIGLKEWKKSLEEAKEVLLP